MSKKSNENTTNSKKGKHLTYANRCKIETLLGEKQSLRYIAECIGCSPSTVSREIRQHIIIKKSYSNDCLIKKDCHRKHVCGGASCIKKCKSCNKCKNYCSDYIQAFCSQIVENHTLCNGCHKFSFCHLEKKYYSAEVAQNEYKEILIGRRNGFDLTGEQLEMINNQVSPLIKKGQSPYHIKQALGDKLIVSETTLRRLINSNELDARAIDLREAVRRKPRKKKQISNELPSPSKIGHLYEDYLDFIKNNDVSVVEMDCVEGKKDDTCAILTLHFITFHMQLYYIMPEHTAECVIKTLDIIEESIGTELFSSIFELILTDNGHEFTDIYGMERSIHKGKRTRIFFCEPNRSDQKGACENNHKLFRCIVPRGTSIDNFSQSDMVLATNHINSYRRKSLFGKSPYKHAMSCLPDDFFILLGLEEIPDQEVFLSPLLFKLNNSK